MARAEVTILGAGVTGLACAWACAERGARVRVIDPGGIGAGASGGVVGSLSPHAPERWDALKAIQFAALRNAPTFWAGVAAAGGGDPGLARTGRLMPLRDDQAVAAARQREAAAQALWQGEGAWRVEPAPEDWGPVSPTGLVVHDTLAARIAPRRALAALAAAIRARGGEIVAAGPEEGAVIEAMGAAGLAARGWGGGVKGQAARLCLPGREEAPQIHAPGLYIVPHADGTVAVGSTSEDRWDDLATDARLDAVLERAVALVPALAGAPVVERWAGLRPRAATGRPVLGAVGPGRFVANGGFRIGLALAPEMARLMADLVLEGRDAVPEAFRPPPAA
ncbi:Glycine/D-amino acid oxidase (deaminating) [Rubellimicrobium thermophilum DSM 16684]|uniref:Glycine/D-amino acid oxidase (Deaminating) n=1 Tax=Rubellimicrobium thermophilum DSM 16684 TaxID=1123069 RepID=S9QYI9_9RHOB|nr:FAD-dependent oxidoreductase [Rubellimicrobium thermophilum]EPX84698.1 Glycine/D-amino acid oxidase (deaminating) [Rubellimicrobium thermophilum DSM 16684]